MSHLKPIDQAMTDQLDTEHDDTEPTVTAALGLLVDALALLDGCTDMLAEVRRGLSVREQEELDYGQQLAMFAWAEGHHARRVLCALVPARVSDDTPDRGYL